MQLELPAIGLSVQWLLSPGLTICSTHLFLVFSEPGCQWLKFPPVATQIIGGNVIPRWGVNAFWGPDRHRGLPQLGYSGYSASKGIPTPPCHSGHPLAVE